MFRLFRRSAPLALAWLPAAAALAQAPLTQWHHLDPVADQTMGISTERAYALLRQQGRQPSAWPVVVAVIDGGIDTTHADLRRVLWHNPAEVPANGLDDDHNGYADDVYGWNFMGGPGGYNVFDNQKEETRTYARLRPRYEGKKPADVPQSQRAEFQLYEQAKTRYATGHAKAAATYEADTRQLQADEANLARLRQGLGRAVLDSATLHHPELPPTRYWCGWPACTTPTCGAIGPPPTRCSGATAATTRS